MSPASQADHQDDQPGSSIPGEPEFLVVGKLGKPHGIQGEIVMDILTDFPERLEPGVVVWVGFQYNELRITKKRNHSRGMLLSFEGYQKREEVAELRNQLVYVRTADLPQLEEGEYYQHQMLGMQVIDEAGDILGTIVSIHETGANDVYIVKEKSGEELLIPAIESVILNIDLEHHQLHIRLLPGLLPDN
jgi:16S rRNA processing protein RimM